MHHLDTYWSVQEILFYFAELGQFQGQDHDQDHTRGSQRSHTKGGVTPDLQVYHHTKTLAKSRGQCLVGLQFSGVMEFAPHQGYCCISAAALIETACFH